MSVIRQARTSNGLTLLDASKRIGVSVSHLRRIEAGGLVSFRLARRLAALYGIPAMIFVQNRSGRSKAPSTGLSVRGNHADPKLK
jgi:transcriptional regulator with XRE-family HTH domain